MDITLRPIATAKNSSKEPTDDYWETIIAEIELAAHIETQSFDSISDFSHLEIIYYFDKVKDEDIIFSGHPRGNLNYPLAGIFRQRKKDSPNKTGLATVALLAHNGRTAIKVKYLDAIDGTPALDIKPVFKECQLKTAIRQPTWADNLMKNYWK
ncbi:MAG TPA: TrmO family methyltransferase [Arachidicoccus sp.]